jgi:hypothetical protein
LRGTVVAVIAAGLAALSLASCSPPPKEYDYPAWGFSASFPGPPKLTETAAAADGSAGHSLLVASDTDLHQFEVFAIEQPSAGQSIDEFADAAGPTVAHSVGGEVESHTYVATVQLTDQAMGREILITKHDRPLVKMRVYVVGGRYYQIVARSRFGPSDPAAVAFLDSFKILPTAPAAANATPPP